MKEKDLHPITRKYYNSRQLYHPNYVGEKESIEMGSYTSAYEKYIEELEKYESDLSIEERKLLYNEIILNEEECIRYTKSRKSIYKIASKRKNFMYPSLNDIEKSIELSELLVEHCRAKLEIISNNNFRIAIEITGYGKENFKDSESPSLRHIKRVLSKHNLNPVEAIDIVNDNREAFSHNFNRIVVPKIIEYLNSIPLLNPTKAKPIIGTLNNSPLTKKEVSHHDFNPNHFDENTYKLFNYLIDKYTKTGSIKYINIYYFLKQLCKDNSDDYYFAMKIEKEYKPYIKEHFHHKITKFEKAKYEFDDVEFPKLSRLERAYRNEIEKNL